MNVIVPMCGTGTITVGGVRKPRFLVEIIDKPLFAWATRGLSKEDRVYFIIRRADYDTFDIGGLIGDHVVGNKKVILLDNDTKGQAVTALAAQHYVDSDDGLLILAPDHICDCDFQEVASCDDADCSGSIVIANEIFCGEPIFHVSVRKVGDQCGAFAVNYITPDSDDECFPVAGAYYWKFGFEFIRYAKMMIEKGHKYKGKFYIPPVFNEAVMDDKQLEVYEVESSSFIQRKTHVRRAAIYLEGEAE